MVNLIQSEFIKKRFFHINISFGIFLQYCNQTILDLNGMTLAVLHLVVAMLVLLAIMSMALVIIVYYTRKCVKSKPRSYITAHKGLHTNVCMCIYVCMHMYVCLTI